MTSPAKVSLQARIHWRCLRWFKAVKWPSANEVDFGDFLVAYDFKNGVAVKQFSDGTTQPLATFAPQKDTREVSVIVGGIHCANHMVTLQQPLVSTEGKVGLTIRPHNSETEHALDGGIRSSLGFGDHFTITPKIEEPDVFLEIKSTIEKRDLAVFVASLLVFQRFA